MAGAVGRVTNKSGFSSYIVKDWQPWMTEAVVLHASGMSIPELRVRFGRTDSHITNVIRTPQATEIIRKIQSNSLKNATSQASERLAALREKAIERMEDLICDDELRKESPFAFWEASRKTLDTVSRISLPPSAPSQPSPSTQIGTVNIQQNTNVQLPAPNASAMAQLRAAPTMIPQEVAANVEYLGSPPPAGQDAGAVHGHGVSGTASESKNGLTFPSRGGDLSADGRSGFPF